MSSILKSIGTLVILVLAALGVLVVFDVVSLAAFGEYAGKVVLTACIIGLASVALTFLLRARS